MISTPSNPSISESSESLLTGGLRAKSTIEAPSITAKFRSDGEIGCRHIGHNPSGKHVRQREHN